MTLKNTLSPPGPLALPVVNSAQDGRVFLLRRVTMTFTGVHEALASEPLAVLRTSREDAERIVSDLNAAHPPIELEDETGLEYVPPFQLTELPLTAPGMRTRVTATLTLQPGEGPDAWVRRITVSHSSLPDVPLPDTREVVLSGAAPSVTLSGWDEATLLARFGQPADARHLPALFRDLDGLSAGEQVRIGGWLVWVMDGGQVMVTDATRNVTFAAGRVWRTRDGHWVMMAGGDTFSPHPLAPQPPSGPEEDDLPF